MKQLTTKSNIYIYGGCFDPIHNGHKNIINYLTHIPDSLCIVALATSPRWKTPVASISDRRDMVEIALDNAYIKNYVIEEDNCPYTVDNVKNIIHKYGEDKHYYLVIGSDQVNDFDKWYNVRELHKLVDIVYVPRTDNINIHNIKKYHMNELPIETTEVSSSEIRNGNISQLLLDYGVYRYIKNFNIYEIK